MDMWRRFDLQLFAEDGDAGSGSGDAPQAPSTDAGGSGSAKTYTEDYVRALRGEAAGYRTQLRQLESVLGAIKQYFGVEGEVKDWRKVLESHKAAQEQALAQATQRAQQMLITAEIKAQAAALGIVDPDAAAKLADLSGVKVGDDGTVTGVKEALEELLQAKPYLRAAGPSKVGAPSNPAGATNTGETNPWLKDHFNLTEQGRIMREDPAKARRMMAEAGVKIK